MTATTSHSDQDLELRQHPAYDLGALYGAAVLHTITDDITPDSPTLARATAILDWGRAITRADDERTRATDRDDEAAAAYWYGVQLALTEARS